MIKYAGIALVCISVSAYGAYLSSNLRNLSKVQQEIIEFLYHIQSGIRYGNSSLEMLYESFTSPLLEQYGFMKYLRDRREVCETVRDTLFILQNDEQNKITEFLSQLGKSHFSEKELNLCSSCLEFFREKQRSTAKENETKALLYKKIGLIVSLLCAILLI